MKRVSTIGLGLIVCCLVAGTALAEDANLPNLEASQAPIESTDVAPADHVSEQACTAHPYSILFRVEDVRKSEGLITVDLHGDDPEKFLKGRHKISRMRVPAVKGITEVCVPVERPGIYAAALYHDEDGDKKFDKNFLGIPTEPFGLTNNPPIRLARPKHKASAFEVNGPATLMTVDLKH